MEEPKRRPRRKLDLQFKLSVLKDYYESGSSLERISRKYSLSRSNIREWERKFASNLLPLPSDISELEADVFMTRVKKSYMKDDENLRPQSEEERLREENARLRKALEYSELRNEALNEVLRIGREQYGIDLLKKAGAKQ